jgi:hypothetical protein
LLTEHHISLNQQQFDAMILLTFQFGQYSWSPIDEKAYVTMRDFIIEQDYSESALRQALATYMGSNALEGTIARLNDVIGMFVIGDYTRDWDYSRPY